MQPALAPAPGPNPEEAAGVLRSRFGLQLSEHLRSQLPETIARAAAVAKLPAEALLQRLAAEDPAALDTLIDETVVPETYFWRHPDQLVEAARAVRAEFPGEPLRVWSAGCATGEEPYSLAMALLEAGAAPQDVSVIGTDVSGRNLQRAQDSRYGDWSFRAIPDALRSRYFEIDAPQWLRPREVLRKRVRFARHNLHRDPPLAERFHLIFCRNVFIYFAPDAAAAALRRLYDALLPGGLLVIGVAEFPLATTLPMAWVDLKGVTALKKVGPGSAPAHAPMPARREREPGFDRAVRLAHPPPVPATRAPIGKPPRDVAPRVSVPATPEVPLLESAREAARAGDAQRAEALALEAGRDRLVPEAWLLVAALREQRGDVTGALEATRRALYLSPSHAMAHAMQIPLFLCTGRPADAERARRNALRTLEGRDDADLVFGVEPSTVAALRRALSSQSPSVRQPLNPRP